jgi:haloalkane dehalogenase
MDVLRTPDERFVGVEGWDFEPCYSEVTAADGTALRMHHVDEGPRDAPPVLLLHGNPSWSYLHRAMIRGLVARGHRAVALDLVGFGRSDKPADRSSYTLAAHVDWLEQWLSGSGLTDITLYCQDWGGLAGLQLLPRRPDRFARIVASNTGIPSGEGVNETMARWLEFSQSVDALPVAALVDNGTGRDLTPGERAAYEAPFPDGSYQAGALQFPLLIPVQPDNPGVPMCRATWEFLGTWTKPFLTVMGSEDAIAYKPGAGPRRHRGRRSLHPGGRAGSAGRDHRCVRSRRYARMNIRHRSRLVASCVALAALTLAACGSSGGAKASGDAPRTAASTTSPDANGARTVKTKDDLRGKRYCEVLLLHPAPAGITADVYNTYPLNECPEAQWRAMDAGAIARENSMLVALLNGPRYWLMDSVEQQQSGADVHKTFGGMEMIQRATVLVGNPIEASKPYHLNAVDRRTVFSFAKGRTVYELTTADGQKFVMQSWSQQVDPALAEAGLARLGARLHLPGGWSYAARVLTAPMRVVTTSDTAKVLQDDFKNSYSLETT